MATFGSTDPLFMLPYYQPESSHWRIAIMLFIQRSLKQEIAEGLFIALV